MVITLPSKGLWGPGRRELRRAIVSTDVEKHARAVMCGWGLRWGDRGFESPGRYIQSAHASEAVFVLVARSPARR